MKTLKDYRGFMKKVSVAEIRKFKPCYDPTKIKGITETTEMTLLEWLQYKAKKLKDADKVWLASKVMTERQCRVFAIWCARACKTKIREITEYLDVIERYYIHGTATKEELRAADWAANRAANRTANWAANSVAYWAADWAANSAANWAAYRTAYWAAYRTTNKAANSAARKKQVKYLIGMLKTVK